MPDRRCCCTVGCELGEDDFSRDCDTYTWSWDDDWGGWYSATAVMQTTIKRSGTHAVSIGNDSLVKTFTVCAGGGTLTVWHSGGAGYIEVDGVLAGYYTAPADWTQRTVSLSAGTHEIALFGTSLGTPTGWDDITITNALPVDLSDDPKWKVLSGTWELDDGTVIGDGVLATRICHPAVYEHGSYIALMDLMTPDDTEVKWAVTAGDPSNPSYYIVVEWTPVSSQATIKVYTGSELPANLLEEYTYSGVVRTSGSIGPLKVCYAPSLMLTVQIGANIPIIDVCDGNAGANCYTHGGQPVGGFSFAEGRFDNWTYEVHWLDDPECDLCSCFCVKDHATGDFACYPTTLTLTFVSVGAVSATLGDITLYQENPAGTGYPEKYYWYSRVQDCGSPVYAKWAIRFECPGIPQEGVSNLGLISLLDETFMPGGSTQVAFSWADGAVGAGRDAIDADSTCNPLELVFPELRVNCAYPSPTCSDPALMESPYCSSLAGNCYATCPDIRFQPILTLPP